MVQLTRTSIYLGVLLCGGLFVPSLPAATATAANPTPLEAQTEELHPFTHLAYIAAGADSGSIRFEGIQRVHVPIAIKHTADTSYCSELALREPGGSMFCPSEEVQAAVAYEATYSYTGQPMASDEIASRRFTFRVYFRYNELAPAVLHTASVGKPARAEMAEYFTVNTYREPVQRIVIDSARSSFCAGAFQDGVWTPSDRSCRDDIRYTAAATPSDYITVKVDALPLGRTQAPLAAKAKGTNSFGLSQ